MKQLLSAYTICAFSIYGCASPTNSTVASDRVSGKVEGKAVYLVKDEEFERAIPDPNASPVNRIYRGQKLFAYEQKGDWIRISEYSTPSHDGKVRATARWIPAGSISADRPSRPSRLPLAFDDRLEGLPDAPGQGKTEYDVYVLRAAATYFLEVKRATTVNFGDKSIHRPGYYYLNLDDGMQNTFFRPDQIPNLDRRIEALKK
jgi:hypothetical protein